MNNDSNKSFKLKKKDNFNCKAKFLIIVLDGVGFTDEKNNINFNIHKRENYLPSTPFFCGNSVNATYTPNLFKLYSSKLFRTIKAHGRAVGLPSDDDMGNSEVGHNAIGSGRIFAQGAQLVNAAIASGEIFTGQAWKQCVERPQLKQGENCLHLCGLLSDGNVHSHIEHLFALIKGAKQSQIKTVRLHLLLDGRDVSPLSALDYVGKLEDFLLTQNSDEFDCQIASGGGRSFVTMDRYESDWSIVERGYQAHVLGEARPFSSIREAIETYRQEGQYFDQDLPAFVIEKHQTPIGVVKDNDTFILFNFRGDRALQISRALTEENFTSFVRKKLPKIHFAGIMQYDGDLQIPENYLVAPPTIKNGLTELLSGHNVKQFACSETQKYGHVTYFWNGNRSEKFNEACENYVEIPSDKISFSKKPWMKSAEIADETISQMENNSFQIGRINFPNGDMVGHTGDFAASIVAIGATDLALGRIMQAAKATNTVLILTSDHGNADEMYEIDKKTKKVSYDHQNNPKPKTSHTLSPVPFAIYNEDALEYPISLRNDLPEAGLANIAATVLELAGFYSPPFYEPSLIEFTQMISKPEENEEIKKTSLLSQSLTKVSLPTLNFAVEISKRASGLGFCWPALEDVFRDIELEVIELKHEVQTTPHALDKICDEIGDVVFSISNFIYCLQEKYHYFDFNFDTMVRQAIDKFCNRFQEMETILLERGQAMTESLARQLTLDEWMELWKEAKKRRYR